MITHRLCAAEKGAFCMAYTKEDIIRIVREEDIKFIRMQFTDIFGAMKSLTITASQLDRALRNDYKFDGSSVEGFARIEESATGEFLRRMGI